MAGSLPGQGGSAQRRRCIRPSFLAFVGGRTQASWNRIHPKIPSERGFIPKTRRECPSRDLVLANRSDFPRPIGRLGRSSMPSGYGSRLISLTLIDGCDLERRERRSKRCQLDR